MPLITIVDDNRSSRLQLQRVVTSACAADVRSFDGVGPALQSFSEGLPDLLIVDYLMPQATGLDLVRLMRQLPAGEQVPVLMITGFRDVHVESHAREAGISMVMVKPLDLGALVKALGGLLASDGSEAAGVAHRTAGPLFADGQLGRWSLPFDTRDLETLDCLEQMAARRDNDTGLHTLRMAHYAALIARRFGLAEQDQQLLLAAAPLHDLGKVGIPDAILLKPGPLTREERQTMQQHAIIGYEILKRHSGPVFRAGAEIALTHHEHFDGSGYPNRLAGDRIPLFGRIVAIADVFDALTTQRPYKQAWPIEAALEAIRLEAGKHFDPDLCAAMVDCLPEILTAKAHFDREDDGIVLPNVQRPLQPTEH